MRVKNISKFGKNPSTKPSIYWNTLYIRISIYFPYRAVTPPTLFLIWVYFVTSLTSPASPQSWIRYFRPGVIIKRIKRWEIKKQVYISGQTVHTIIDRDEKEEKKVVSGRTITLIDRDSVEWRDKSWPILFHWIWPPPPPHSYNP